MKTLIIAEAGVNHNGSLARAQKMVSVAAEAGADLVKFQSFVTDKSISRQAPKAHYQKGRTDPAESQFDMVRNLELSKEDHDELVAECRRRGIGFFSTAFDSDSLEMLLGLGLSIVKIPSGEITNLPFLRQVGRLGKDVLLSTGMATLGEVEAAIDVLERAGTPRTRMTVLHCTTEYPAPMGDVNLRAMQSLRAAFGVAVGYSDHTAGIEVALAAVAMGACVIEKHFTLDRNLPGPDHRASLEPGELKAMVAAIRHIEIAMGDGIKRVAPSEIQNKRIARKSLVAAQPIKRGEVFSDKNIAAKRPGTGISPMRWDEIMGLASPRDFAADELIEL